jgi:hypothetical protein
VSNIEPTEEIILDACCLINLFASGCVRDLLNDLPARFLVARYVCQREALYVLADPSTNEREPITVSSFASEGLLQIVDLVTDEEAASFVDLTARIEDGEAATCALALHRKYTVATDERKVLNLIRRTMPALRVRTTAELVKLWAETTVTSEQRVGEILRNIRSRARFTPNKQDPLFEWWNRLV